MVLFLDAGATNICYFYSEEPGPQEQQFANQFLISKVFDNFGFFINFLLSVANDIFPFTQGSCLVFRLAL